MPPSFIQWDFYNFLCDLDAAPRLAKTNADVTPMKPKKAEEGSSSFRKNCSHHFCATQCHHPAFNLIQYFRQIRGAQGCMVPRGSSKSNCGGRNCAMAETAKSPKLKWPQRHAQTDRKSLESEHLHQLPHRSKLQRCKVVFVLFRLLPVCCHGICFLRCLPTLHSLQVASVLDMCWVAPRQPLSSAQ